MCEPTTIAAMAALAVGTGLKMKADNDRQSDMKKLQRRETERSDGLFKEAQQNVLKNRETYERENVEQQMAAASGERQAQYAKTEAAAPRANEAPVGATGGNQVINDAFARALESAKGEATQSGALRAELASFGDTMGANAMDNSRRTGEIGMTGSFQQGNARILPLELNHAMTRRRGADTWGSILQAFGGAMLGGAGAGLGAAGGAAGAGAGAGAAGAAAGTGGAMAAGGAMSGVDWSSLFGGG